MGQIRIPEHDEKDAANRLVQEFRHLVEDLSFSQPPKGESRIVWSLAHPDFALPIMKLSYDGMTPFEVQVFPSPANRGRWRRFIFHPNGWVVVEKPPNPYGVFSEETSDSVADRRIKGWRNAANYMIGYISRVLREAAAWECELAQNLEKKLA